MILSSLAYLIGVLGGIGGLIATMRDIAVVDQSIGLLILLASIALLWATVLLESIEESYLSAGA